MLFDKDIEYKNRQDIENAYRRGQDDLAAKSDAFMQILAYERDNNDLMGSTNRPDSLVRNAMILRSLYAEVLDDGSMTFDCAAWGKDLLSSALFRSALEEKR